MIEYKIGLEEMNWHLLVELYYEVDGVIGLGRKRDLITIKRSFLNSYKVVTAWDRNKIVGAGRMLSDGYCYGWIHDIGVLNSYRRNGIGKRIMDILMDEEESLLFGLTSSFMAIDFYDKLGFKRHKTAMAKYPSKSTYLDD